MALEKKRMLRKVEFTLTDNEVHPVCHCEYQDIVFEDGNELARSTERLTMSSKEWCERLMKMPERKMPENLR